MRPAFIAGIVIGIGMLVIGLLGPTISAYIPFTIGGSYFKDDFTSLSSSWTTLVGFTRPTCDGNNLIIAPTGTSRVNILRTVGLSGKDTIGAEMKFKITQAGTPGFSFAVFWLTPTEKGMTLGVTDNSIMYYNSAIGAVGSKSVTHSLNQDYILTMQGTFSAGTYSIWEGSTLIVQDTAMLVDWSPGLGYDVSIGTLAGSGGSVSIDYVDVGTSGGPTGGSTTNPPSVQITVWSDTSRTSRVSGKTVTVYKTSDQSTVYSGVTGSNGTVPADGSRLQLVANVQYRFSLGTFSDTQHYDGSFSENSYPAIDLYVGGGGGQTNPHPIGDLLNDPTVRMILEYGGGALAGLSVIGFAIPKSKPKYYPDYRTHR